MTVVQNVGRKRGHDRYSTDDWRERDNFRSVEAAESYAGTLSRMYPRTPYRIVRYEPEEVWPRVTFAVEFVPEHRLVAA